jgi:hypothetical protein
MRKALSDASAVTEKRITSFSEVIPNSKITS